MSACLDLRIDRIGCSVCGKIGCDCNDVADTFSASVCKKCKSDPCECEGTPLARCSNGICTACRRSQANCICTSHHGVKSVLDVAIRPQHSEVRRPYSESYIGTLVNEGMNHYYNRDADGLARWLRKALR